MGFTAQFTSNGNIEAPNVVGDGRRNTVQYSVVQYSAEPSFTVLQKCSDWICVQRKG